MLNFRLQLLLVMLLTTSTATAQNITFDELWRIDTGAVHYNKPALEGDRLYAAGEDGVLRTINRQTGDVVWSYEAAAGIGSSVGVDDTRVYVTSRDGVVHGVSKSSGEGLWTFTTEGEKQWDHWDYYLSTPVADAKHWLYVGSGDHHVYSINKRTGTLRWKYKTGAVVHGDPVLSGEKVIIGGFDGYMYALDQANGRKLWAFKTVGNAYFRDGAIPGTAAVADGHVFFGSRDFNLYALLEETGTGAWNIRTPSWVVARPLVVDGRLYVGTSDSPRVYAIDARSSREYWQTRVSHNVFGSAAALGDTLIAVPGLDGRIHLLDRESGDILARHDTRAASRNREDYFDSEGRLLPGDIQTFDGLIARYDGYIRELGGIAGGLVVADDTLYYADGAGSIVALQVGGIPQPGEEQQEQ